MKRPERREEEYIHLVRLAWDLNVRGLSAAVDLPSGGGPVLLVAKGSGLLKVTALAQDGQWFFTWGRGRAQQVRALADDAADRVRQAVR
ncbi:hypothetical protein [Sphaerisporangium rhizosphaerae]|uniref:Uncharacterized protein n=1 Tax=Sphaerisporangium rhizosphaerae TaxID=2269375 RepID=A0ABW2P2M1_9ACTN